MTHFERIFIYAMRRKMAPPRLFFVSKRTYAEMLDAMPRALRGRHGGILVAAIEVFAR